MPVPNASTKYARSCPVDVDDVRAIGALAAGALADAAGEGVSADVGVGVAEDGAVVPPTVDRNELRATASAARNVCITGVSAI